MPGSTPTRWATTSWSTPCRATRSSTGSRWRSPPWRPRSPRSGRGAGLRGPGAARRRSRRRRAGAREAPAAPPRVAAVASAGLTGAGRLALRLRRRAAQPRDRGEDGDPAELRLLALRLGLGLDGGADIAGVALGRGEVGHADPSGRRSTTDIVPNVRDASYNES